MAANAYNDHQNRTLLALLLAGQDVDTIARIMDRTPASILRKATIFRDDGLLKVAPKGTAIRNFAPRTAANDPGITLKGDDALVEDCLNEGGFPTAVVLDRRTFWVRPDGRQWAHTPPQPRRRAA